MSMLRSCLILGLFHLQYITCMALYQIAIFLQLFIFLTKKQIFTFVDLLSWQNFRQSSQCLTNLGWAWSHFVCLKHYKVRKKSYSLFSWKAVHSSNQQGISSLIVWWLSLVRMAPMQKLKKLTSLNTSMTS